ncbi:MAG: septum site-determining protein MinC [Anaerolineaceae bacterium]|nr:septum site-determining protein MinC [Anaerolineaceae bacterium]
MVNDRRQMMQIKGIKDGLLVTLAEGEWPELEAALLSHVDERAGFFQGARMALDVGNHILRAGEMGALRDRLSNKGISLWAVVSSSPLTEQTAQMLGMATRISTPRSERTIRPLDTNLEGESAIFVQRTLRSGFKISHHGHIIVLGDVNPGAEVIAGGNIIIWGRLRGVVHAGAEGNENNVVCALDLMPTQLRIAGLVSIPPSRKGKPEPELARIQMGQVVVEPWNPKK